MHLFIYYSDCLKKSERSLFNGFFAIQSYELLYG